MSISGPNTMFLRHGRRRDYSPWPHSSSNGPERFFGRKNGNDHEWYVFSGNGTYWTQLNKGTKSVIEIGPNYGNIYGLRVGAGSGSK